MENFVLTNENYYTQEANNKYMSVSQFKELAGTMGHTPCEDTGLKRAKGLISPTQSTSLLVGSYVDSYFEGTLDEFRQDHPEIFKKTGDKGLKADYIQAEEIISRIEQDSLMSDYLSGEKQKIMTANLFGIDWKIKMDSYHPDDKIVDLKVMKDIKPIWSDLLHQKLDFIRYWGYDIQGAVYQKVVELKTGKKLPFYIACATKEKICDINLIEITQPYLDNALSFVEKHLPRVLDLLNGKTEPEKCGTCAYCKLSKKITKPITIEDIMPVQFDMNDDTDEEEGRPLFDDM